MTPRQATKYLEECGSACPYCDSGPVRRVLSHARLATPAEARPHLMVPCYCGACGRGWGECYRLEDAAGVEP